MTRPMPYTEAPPHPGRSPKISWDDVGSGWLAAKEAWDDARWKYTESIVVGRDKRLKDAECAAEYWRAALEATSSALNNCPECPGCQSMEAEELTWHRFATRPHALEEA